MQHLPQRLTLADQTVAILRQGIRDGLWQKILPSESELMKQLKVGRNTIRAALQQLEREKTIQSEGHGNRRRILQETEGSSKATTQGNIIRALSPTPRHVNDQGTQLIFNAIQEQLSSAGYHLEYENYATAYTHFSTEKMERLAGLPGTCGWMLLWSTREIQSWFSNNKLPCIVLGSVYKGIHLSNVEYDFSAACRHGAGELIRRKHKHIVLFIKNKKTAGALATAEGFLDGARTQPTETTVEIIRHEGTVESMTRELAGLLQRAKFPMGIIVGDAEDLLTVLTYLQNRGIRIPKEVSILARGDDLYLTYLVPSIAGYHLQPEKFGRMAAHLILDVIRHGSGKMRSHKIIPEFQMGGSLRKTS